MNYDDDALDAMLFELPLEEPPVDLRAAILTATIYRPAPIFKPWEVVTLGALAAVFVWIIAMIAMGGGTLFIDTMQTIAAMGVKTFSNLTTLAWIAAGGATAIWLSIFTGFQPAREGAKQQHR